MIKTVSHPGAPRNPATAYFAVLAAAAVLYIATSAPGVVWQDSGVIQYRVWHNDIQGRLGLALSHPLYYMIAIAGKYVLPGQFARRVTTVTALMSAFAVANLFLLLRLWLGRSLPAIVGALSLALGHTFWRHATMPETYNLAAALLLLEMVLLVKYARNARPVHLYLLALVNGLAVANHMLGSIALACYLALVVYLLAIRRIRPRQVALMALLWTIGALPYEYLIVRSLLATGDVPATLASAFFGASWSRQVLNTSIGWRIVKENFLFLVLNYPTPNILLAFVGLAAIYRLSPKRWLANTVLVLATLYLVFAFRYTIMDRYAFFIPFYCFVSVLIGLGAARITQKHRGSRCGLLLAAMCFLTIPAYLLAPVVAAKAGIFNERAREVPYRDDYKYFLQPWKTGNNGAERFAVEALDAAKPNAVILADNTTAPALLYVQQVKGRRPDVRIVSSIAAGANAPQVTEDTIDAVVAAAPVYVVCPVKRYCPPFVLERYAFEKEGLLYRLVKKDSR